MENIANSAITTLVFFSESLAAFFQYQFQIYSFTLLHVYRAACTVPYVDNLVSAVEWLVAFHQPKVPFMMSVHA